jgi:hypothetical protein
MNTQEKELYNLVNAGVKLIQIVSYETLRFHGMLIHVSKETGRDLYVWNRVEGIKQWVGGDNGFEEEDSSAVNPDSALDFYNEHDNIILLLEDFYPDLTDDKPRMIRNFRNIAMQGNSNKTLVFSQPFLQLPKELENIIPADQVASLIATLQQDPRPRYHNDPNRIYGMPFLTFDIRFKVADNVLTVVEIK